MNFKPNRFPNFVGNAKNANDEYAVGKVVVHDRQIGHTRVNVGEVRVVLTTFVAFYSDFLESDETPIICFEPHLTREIGATLFAFCNVSILAV